MTLEDKDDNPDDKIVTVRLTKKDLKMIDQMIEREKALTWFGAWLRQGLMWGVMGFAALFIGLWDWIKNALYSLGAH